MFKQKRVVILFSVIAVSLLVVYPVAAQGGRGNGQRGNPPQGGNQFNCCQNLPAAVVGELPDEVVEAITNGIMDEYNAYNTYQAVIDQFGMVRPFTNIQVAEAQHIAAWEVIFNRYGITIPEAPVLESIPAFSSLQEACQIAANAEIANFGLYDDMLVTAEAYPDIIHVITALKEASQYNHLPAFEACASR